MPVILAALMGCPTPEGAVDLQALQSRLDAQATQLDAQAARIAALEAELDAQDLSIYATDQELAGAVSGLASTSDLAPFLTQPDIDALDLASRTDLEDALLDRVIAQSLTVEVPADFPDLNAVLDAYADRVFLPGAFLNVEIADSPTPYVYAEPIIVEHPYGAHLVITGNAADPSAVVLQFAGTDGIEVRWGSALAYLDGVTLRGTNGGTTTGIYVHHNSSAGIGDVRIEGFTRSAVNASIQSFVSVDSLVSTSPTDVAGVLAEWNSTLWANAANISGSTGEGASFVQGARGRLTNSTIVGGNRGVVVSDGSSVVATGSDVSAQQNALELTAHSMVRASGSAWTSAGANGASVQQGSYADLAGATLSNSADNGVECFTGSYCDLFDAVVEGNMGSGLLVQVGSTASTAGLTFNGGNTGGNTNSSGVSASETFDPYVP
ncbi:MAG: hypothetical protein R3F61_04220 [Myxococcota bacterium]